MSSGVEIPFIEAAPIATHASALEQLAQVRIRVREKFAPPPDILPSEWARRNRIMTKGSSSRPGAFIPEKFQIEMMDVIVDPNVHEIVVKKSTQIGYSDAVLNNIVGYYIDIDPKPMMFVQPTIDNAKDYGKKRITPMIRATACLKAKVSESKSRDGGNTLGLKEFPGGFLKLTGANSGTGLRSDPVPVVLLDEIEGYPLDCGEGDPVEIAKRRTDAYHDYKIVEGSTPGKPKGLSRIEKRFEESDQRYYAVPCPFCRKEIVLLWRDPESKEYRLTYELEGNRVVRSSVRYLCPSCKKGIPERFKQQMIDGGRWIAKFPGRDVVGFYINALYSPWRENWHELAQEWHDATKSKDPEKLKAFLNLRLAECWEEDGDTLDGDSLKARLEPYQSGFDVPNGVAVLSCSVDVQGDRLEVVVKGWGAGEESWLIAYQQFFGDPGQEKDLPDPQTNETRISVWNELDEFLKTEFRHQSGRRIPIAITFIDSGGHHTESVYRFVKARQSRKIFAVKGASEAAQPILARWSVNNSYRVKLWSLGTDTAKDRVFSRLAIPKPENANLTPGYIHLPDWADEEYLAQLTAEKRVKRYKRGLGMVSEYVKTRARNEALDLEVYALAALYALGAQTIRNLEELAAEMAIPVEGEDLEGGSGGGGEPDPGGEQGSSGSGGTGSGGSWTTGGGGSGWVSRW